MSRPIEKASLAHTSHPGTALEAVRALARASSVMERCSPELSLAQYRILSAIAAGSERASTIAAKLALGKPTVSTTVDSLCHRGLLARRQVSEDQRAASLCLTPEGSALLAAVEAEMLARMEDLCRRTPDGARLVEALGWLGQAMDERRAERLAARERSERGRSR